MSGYENLANAIITQAARDYKYALKHLKDPNKDSIEKHIIEECEKFFRSDYFKILTKLDGERLMSMIKEKCRNESNSRAKHKKPNRNDF